jgi:MT-A70
VADERPFGDLPRGHFGAILADPPWKYVTYSERGQGRSASRHYEVMIFEEIATLPVRDVAAPDAWLFLWVPGPHLPFGLQLIERARPPLRRPHMHSAHSRFAAAQAFPKAR